MDKDNAAALRFVRMVRQFCARAKVNTAGVLFLETTPSERWDVSKLSQRVYGNRHETLAIMAACGMDQLTQPLEQKLVALPTPAKLLEIKRECGFESVHELRSNGQPIWRRD